MLTYFGAGRLEKGCPFGERGTIRSILIGAAAILLFAGCGRTVSAADEPVILPVTPIASAAAEKAPPKEAPADAEKMDAETTDAEPTDTAQTENEEPYDPIRENGVYFEGWEKPKVALVLSGLMNGYIEPCGCAGMDRMKGGLSRRLSFLKDLAEKEWPVIPIDAGQIANGFGVQEELKFDMAVNALRLMGYEASGISPNELRFPAYFLLTFTIPPNIEEKSLFVSANVGVYGFNELYTLPYKVIEKAGVKIGVTSVVFAEDRSRFDENIHIEPAEKKLREILPKIKAEKCDHLVLIVHGSEAETAKMAAAFPEFDIIITGDSPTEPPAEAKQTPTRQYLIELGEKGKYCVVLGLYDDAKEPIRYQRVALDSRYRQSEEVQLLLSGYQEILKGIITTKGYKGLGLGEIDSPSRAMLGEYIGSAKCESCHEESYRTWRKNRHSTAWNSLATDPPTVHTANPLRDFDPECISCHVIGWQGSENFPYTGGFQTIETTPHLANVGCESCHGPGSKHSEAELGDDAALQEKIRAAMRLGNRTKQVCHSCHDGDNSPEFDFDTYYKKIEHFDDPEAAAASEKE